jgi:hypothetical protein
LAKIDRSDCITIPHKEINLRNVDDVVQYLLDTKRRMLKNQQADNEVCYCTYVTKSIGNKQSFLQLGQVDQEWVTIRI